MPTLCGIVRRVARSRKVARSTWTRLRLHRMPSSGAPAAAQKRIPSGGVRELAVESQTASTNSCALPRLIESDVVDLSRSSDHLVYLTNWVWISCWHSTLCTKGVDILCSVGSLLKEEAVFRKWPTKSLCKGAVRADVPCSECDTSSLSASTAATYAARSPIVVGSPFRVGSSRG